MKRLAFVVRIFLVAAAICVLDYRPSVASDHIDGPISLANQVSDIIDFFAYPTPGNPNSLTMILDAYPFASSSSHFSDRVNYNFILRKASPSQDGTHVVTDASSEVVITCRFMTPQRTQDTQMICASNEAQPRVIGQIGFNEVQQPKVGNNIQLFGGRRADPFFLSAGFAGAYMKFENPRPDGKNVMNNLNCLSIVMNIDIDKIFPNSVAAVKAPKTPNRKVAQADSFFIAAAVESVTFDRPGAAPRRLDRIGRPEVTNVSLNMKSAEPEVRDSYNSDRPFNVPPGKTAFYIQRLRRNMDSYDRVDGRQDWSANDLTRLATMIADDYLVVDPFATCQRSTFFEIEAAMLMGRQHQGCGGRDPNDNAVNKMYTLYQKGAAAMASVSVHDGLTGPSKPISRNFPYLAEPYDGIGAWFSQKFADAVKKFL